MLAGPFFMELRMAKAQKTLSRRVLVTINRGITTKTPVLVWEHEIPILEAIHGEGTVMVVEKPAALLDEGFKANRRMPEITAPSTHLGLGDVFDGDPRAEYDRLSALYGMHAELKLTNCEYVYGRFQEGRFAAAVAGAELDDLTERQIRDKLVALKVEVPRNLPVPELRKMLAAEQAI